MKVIKRYRNAVIAAAMCMWLLSANSHAASGKNNEITIVIPRGVLQAFINEVLPVEITTHDKVSGHLWIRSINDLRLGLDKVWFTATIHGENIAYKGKIGGLPVNLRFNAIDSTLNCEASIRYDSKKGLLYARPVIADEGKKDNALWMLLLSVLGDEEYPLEIQKFKPRVVRVSDKTMEIDMDISNIYTVHDRLFIAVRPTVKATQMDKPMRKERHHSKMF